MNISPQFYRLIVVQMEAAASAEAEKEKERKARKGAGKGKSGCGEIIPVMVSDMVWRRPGEGVNIARRFF